MVYPRNPRAGDTLECKVRVQSKNTYGGFLWAVQESDETSPGGAFAPPGYQLYVDFGYHENIILAKLTGGDDRPFEGENRLLDLNFGIDGTLYRNIVHTARVEWNTDGTMPVTVFEGDPSEGNVFATGDPKPDTEFEAGGIGFVNNGSLPDSAAGVAHMNSYVVH